MANRVGQELNAYRLIRLLGWTSSAEVYLAEHVVSRKQVVLKLLRVALSEDDLDSFTIASRAITGLVHPHIIEIPEIGIADRENSFPVLVMEYAPNGTLRQHYPIGSRLPLTTVLPYVRQIAEALHYAHLQKLIHADVKPENILLGSNNQILVSDFSIALISSISSSAIAVNSTTAYLAPEQIRGQSYPTSDEYALGVMVYEWLSGELPFSGSLSEMANQHLFTSPPPLRIKIPDISSTVEEVVLTALAKDPKSRFANLLAFANALEQAGQPVHHYSSAFPSLTVPPDMPTLPAVVGMPQNQMSSTVVDRPQGPPLSERKEPNQPSPAFHLATLLSHLPMVVGPRPASEMPHLSTRRISRRVFMIGLPGVVVAGGIIAWLMYQKESLTTNALDYTLLTYSGHAGEVTVVAWSPNGKYIASGGNDHTIRVWNAGTGTDLLISHGHSGGVPAITWSPDSTYLASASAGPLASGGPPASDNAVQVWSATTGKPIYFYRGHSSGITDVTWSPTGNRIASSSTDYTVQVWDATTGQHPLIYRTHSWYIQAEAWSPDGRRLASGGPDGTIQLWDAVSGHTFHSYRGHSNGIESIAWSPDGRRIATASDDDTVRIWDVATGRFVYIYRGHASYVRAVAWSPDGSSIASGSSDKTVQVWDAATGGTGFIYRGHSGSVTSVVWSPDGSSIASGSEDGTVKVWQVP